MQITLRPLGALAVGPILLASALAASAAVTNGSFEMPSTQFVNPQIDGWQKTPQPGWFDPGSTGGITWDQLSGVFANPPEGQASRKENIDGNQAAFLIALAAAGVVQVLPDTFEPGLSYELTVGVSGGGGNMPVGTALAIGFFYLDGTTPTPLGTTTVAHDTTLFPSTTRFVDISASQPVVGASDAWAGKQIGIQIVNVNGAGVGYWDLDNVRVNAVPEPGTLALAGCGALVVAAAVARRARRP